MELVISLSVLASFLATWIVARKWIRKAPERDLLTIYLQKKINIAIQAVLCIMLRMRITSVVADILGWSMGLKVWQKTTFTHFAAMPLMVIKIDLRSVVR
ncbi:MAG TPA: hypothetical protein PKV33_01585 [Methanothrix sp.]|nr:hypothetical protein [Methanothrix sp.]